MGGGGMLRVERVSLKKQRTGISISEERGGWWPASTWSSGTQRRLSSRRRKAGAPKTPTAGGLGRTGWWQGSGLDSTGMYSWKPREFQCSIGVTQLNSISNSDPQAVHGPRDVELVHGVDDDGGSGEEEQQQEEEGVEEDASEPPARSAHRQVFPGDGRNNERQYTIIRQDGQDIKHTTLSLTTPSCMYWHKPENGQLSRLSCVSWWVCFRRAGWEHTLHRSVLMKEQKYLLNPTACDCSRKHKYTAANQAWSTDSEQDHVNILYVCTPHLLRNLTGTAAFILQD